MKELNHFQTRPKIAPIDIKAYLEKLGLMKELPSLNYLRQIHQKHLLTIPFENLDIHFRQMITLDIRRIFNKIIPKNRGGFCYELNFLFYHLLTHLGYECHLISAQVLSTTTNEYGPEYDHMAILVKIQKDIYLCDVGFGDGFVFPKKIEVNNLQMDLNRYFQFSVDSDDLYYLKKTSDTLHFETLYRFETKFREPIEFIDMCNYHQTSTQSHFTGKKMITILTEEGRITLSDSTLIINERGEKLEHSVLNEDAFYSKMEEHFGIKYQSLLQK